MEATEGFVSKLPKGPARFLAETLEHALVNGRRTADDFVRHFPPSAVMKALDAVPNLRAAFLVSLVGLKERTALRTSASDAGRMLETAFEEGDTDAQALVGMFSPDDRLQYLDPRRVWTFLLEGEFWKAPRSKDGGVYRVAQAHIAFMIDRAMAHQLLSPANLVDGITIEMIAEKLPRNDMARVLKAVIAAGRSGKAFTDAELCSAMSAATLADYVPLPHLMTSVLLPMGQSAGFVEVTMPKPDPAANAGPRVQVPAAPHAPNGSDGAEGAEPWPDSIPAAH